MFAFFYHSLLYTCLCITVESPDKVISLPGWQGLFLRFLEYILLFFAKEAKLLLYF